METVFIWIEESVLSLWVRGETGAHMAFPVIICFHAVGMGFLVGTACVFNARILGAAPGVPLSVLGRFLPIALIGLAMNAISGLLLLIGYPTKALTNPVFYLKLICIALALWSLFWIRRHVLNRATFDEGTLPIRQRLIASLSCLLWVTAIVAGRLLAYTHTRLTSI